MNPVDTLETAKAANPLKQLLSFRQSIWLDYIRRRLTYERRTAAPDR